MDGVPAASLDHNKEEEEEEESFHKFHYRRMMQCSPISRCIDPMWQTTKWLQTCEEGLDEGEISWWHLVSLLADGSDTAVKDMPGGSWPPGDVLNIGQFLDEDTQEQGWGSAAVATGLFLCSSAHWRGGGWKNLET